MFRPIRRVRIGVYYFFFVGLAMVAAGNASRADSRTDANPAWEAERPGRFVPRAGRDEAAEDRWMATVLFAHGRMLFQRQDWVGALRSYVRASRRDPGSVTILNEIIPLAFELKRTDLATRYAVLAAENDPRDPQLLLQLGGYLVSEKDYRRALSMFYRGLAIQKEMSPLNVVAQLEVGRLHFLLEEFPAATSAFEQVRAALQEPERFQLSEPQRKALLENPDKLFSLFGEAALRAGNLETARQCFERAYEAKKNNPLLDYHLARVELARQEWPLAVERLRRYCEANLSEAGTDPYVQLEKALQQQHADPPVARAELLKLLQAYRKRFPANVPLAFFLAENYRRAKEYDQAEPLLQELRQRQAATDLYESLLEIYLDRNDLVPLLQTLAQYQAAAGSLDSLEEFATRTVGDEPRWQQLLRVADLRQQEDGVALVTAQLALQAKQAAVAEKWFQIALDQPTASRLRILTIWGLTMLAADQPARAVQPIRQIVTEKLKPEENATFLNYLVGALALANQVDDALAAIDQLLEMSPDNPRILARRAWLLTRGSRFEQAEISYREVLKKFDDESDSPQLRAVMRECRLALSNLAVINKQLPAAEEWLEQVLDEFPEDTSAENDLGYLWADQGKFLLRAKRMIERAVAKEPDNRAYRDSLGWVLFRLGQYDLALVELRKAVDAQEPDGVVLDHLGDCYEKTNQREEARAYWLRAQAQLQAERDRERLLSVQAKLAK